jgi:hypothetical protein
VNTSPFYVWIASAAADAKNVVSICDLLGQTKDPVARHDLLDQAEHSTQAMIGDFRRARKAAGPKEGQ